MMRHTRAHACSGGTGSDLTSPHFPHSTLEDLAVRLSRLSPSHRDPERFHMDKAELVGELRRLARALGRVSA